MQLRTAALGLERRAAAVQHTNPAEREADAPARLERAQLADALAAAAVVERGARLGRAQLLSASDAERPEAGAYGAYPDGYRRKHRTAPELVQWMSGSLATTPTITVDGPKWHW